MGRHRRAPTTSNKACVQGGVDRGNDCTEFVQTLLDGVDRTGEDFGSQRAPDACIAASLPVVE